MKKGKCYVFGVKQLNGLERRQIVSISNIINHIWSLFQQLQNVEEGKCSVFEVKHQNSSERRQMLSIS